MTVINLDNVGRCDHTYLYHIINNYDNLTDITIFLPGSGNMGAKLNKIKNLIQFIKKHNSAIFLSNEQYTNVKDDLYNFTLDYWSASHGQNRDINPESKLEISKIIPFGKWYECYFNDIHIHQVSYWGIFSVDKRDIFMSRKDVQRFVLSIKEFNTFEPIGSIRESKRNKSDVGRLETNKLYFSASFC